MAIEIRQVPYELLVRFDENGVVGAHTKAVEQVVDTTSGIIYSEKTLAAKAVDLTATQKTQVTKIYNSGNPTEA